MLDERPMPKSCIVDKPKSSMVATAIRPLATVSLEDEGRTNDLVESNADSCPTELESEDVMFSIADKEMDSTSVICF